MKQIMNGNQLKSYLYFLSWVLMIPIQFYTVCALPIGEVGSPAQGKQSKTYNFIKLGATCNHLDAFSKFSLKQIMDNDTEHCDPRLLLTCQTGPLGQKWCDCGLVNAKNDVKQGGKCIPLAGAPCNNVFGNDELPISIQCDLTVFECKSLNPANSMNSTNTNISKILRNYDACHCRDSNERPDAEGGCGGWREGEAIALGASIISIVVLCGVSIFMS